MKSTRQEVMQFVPTSSCLSVLHVCCWTWRPSCCCSSDQRSQVGFSLSLSRTQDNKILMNNSKDSINMWGFWPESASPQTAEKYKLSWKIIQTNYEPASNDCKKRIRHSVCLNEGWPALCPHPGCNWSFINLWVLFKLTAQFFSLGLKLYILWNCNKNSMFKFYFYFHSIKSVQQNIQKCKVFVMKLQSEQRGNESKLRTSSSFLCDQ